MEAAGDGNGEPLTLAAQDTTVERAAKLAAHRCHSTTVWE